MDGFLIGFIAVYGLFNIGYIGCTLGRLFYEVDMDTIDILLPTLAICSDIAEKYDINAIGKWVMIVLYTILVLPAIVLMNFVAGFVYLLVSGFKAIGSAFCWIFRKR